MTQAVWCAIATKYSNVVNGGHCCVHQLGLGATKVEVHMPSQQYSVRSFQDLLPHVRLLSATGTV